MKKYFVFGLAGMMMLFFALSANHLFSSEGETATTEIVEKSYPIVPVSMESTMMSMDFSEASSVCPTCYCAFVGCASYCNPQFICRPNQTTGPVCFFDPFPIASNNCGEPAPCCPRQD